MNFNCVAEATFYKPNIKPFFKFIRRFTTPYKNF